MRQVQYFFRRLNKLSRVVAEAMWWVEIFTGGCGGYAVGVWLDQVGIRLSQLSTKLKLKLKLKLSLAIK